MEILRPTPIKCTKYNMCDKLVHSLEKRAIILYGSSQQYYFSGIFIYTNESTKYKIEGQINEIKLSRLTRWYNRVTELLNNCNIKLHKIDFIFKDAFTEFPEDSKIFVSYYPNRETDKFDEKIGKLLYKDYGQLCEYIRFVFNFYRVYEIYTIKNNYRLASEKNIDKIINNKILKNLNLRIKIADESNNYYNVYIDKGQIQDIDTEYPKNNSITSFVKNIFINLCDPVHK